MRDRVTNKWTRRGAIPTVAIGSLVLVICVFAVCAHGDGSSRWNPAVVLIVSREFEDRSDVLARAVETQFADLRIAFFIEWVNEHAASLADQEAAAEKIAEKVGAFAVIWCDLEEIDRVYFYLTSSSAKRRILVRRVDGSGEERFDEVIAIIARASIDALLEGGEIGVAKKVEKEVDRPRPVDSPKIEIYSEPEPKVETPKQDTDHFALDVAYAFQAVSGDHPAVHGVSLALRARIWRLLSGYAGYTIVQPIEDRLLGIHVSVKHHPVFVGATISPEQGRLRLGATVALNFDFTSESYRPVAVGMEARPSDFRVGIAVVPSIRLDLRIFGALAVFLSLGGEIPLNRAKYTVNDGMRYRTIYEPWPVQPTVLLGVTGTFF